MIKLSDHLEIEPMGKIVEARKEAAKRHYQAARVTRQTRGWTTSPQGANWILRCDLQSLRARARDMAKNSPHFRKFLQMARSNIVGHKGIQLQCDATFGTTGEPYTKLNSYIEEEFWAWGRRETCTESGKLSWADAQQLCVEMFIRDGEVLIEHLEADNPFGYAIKFWNADWLDETHNELLKSGNRVIMGVEVDGKDKPVAYWLTEPASENIYTREQNRYRRRVPAENMTHIFRITEGEDQVRGVTWFHAALLQGKSLHEYSGGVVDSARVAAHTFGFLRQTAGEDIGFDGDCGTCGGAGCSQCGPPPIQINKEPLSINLLDPGFEFQQFDPKQPTQNHSEFMNSMLHTLAAGMGVTGFSLAGDMSQVNFSSARVGLGEEREIWRALQEFVSDTFCRAVFRRWLPTAWLKGRLDFSAVYYSQLIEPTWRPRGWSYIEPAKDIKAATDAIANNLLTYREHFAERGIDLEEWLQAKQKEQKLFATYGIEYAPQPKQLGAAKPEENDDEEEKPPVKRLMIAASR